MKAIYVFATSDEGNITVLTEHGAFATRGVAQRTLYTLRAADPKTFEEVDIETLELHLDPFERS